MTTTAGFNLATFTDLDRARYDEAAALAFAEEALWGIAISQKKVVTGTRSHIFTQVNGLNGAVTSATTMGSDWAETTATDVQRTVTWSPKYRKVIVDQASEAGSIIDLLDVSLRGMVEAAGETFDYHAAKAAVDAYGLLATQTDGYHVVGHNTRLSLTASDVLTLTHVVKGVQKLKKNKAKPMNIPGIGKVFLCFVHPDVAFDLKTATSGMTVFSGPVYVNAPEWRFASIGVAGGCLFIESNAAPLLVSDGGLGAVDTYKSIIVGEGALGMVGGPVASQPNCTDVSLDASGCMIGRISYPGNNLGTNKEVGFVGNIGFGAIHPEAIYQIESSSSIGSNS